MSRTLLCGLAAALLAGLILRCPQLALRPMHNDEAVNAIKLRALWEKGSYQYDPEEFHGPTLPYFTLAWMKLIGPKKFVDFTEAELRGMTVLFGVGLIVLLLLTADGLGREATLGAMFFTAISPAMVFYSRYYIHEMLLVFFTLLALGAGWCCLCEGKLRWALLTGLAIGLMQATKETFVLTLAAIAAALILNQVWLIWFAEKPMKLAPVNLKTIGAIFGAWLATVLVLFSSFFSNRAGIMDSVRTYRPWIHRAAGASPHIHPWNYYLARLAFFHSGKGPYWSEGLILVLAMIGFGAVLLRKKTGEGNYGFIRFLGFYTLILTGIYCAIGYKTPWCLLTFWEGMIMLAGVGAVFLVHSLPGKILKICIAFAMVMGGLQLTWQAYQASFVYPASLRNPYVYAQTSPDILNLVERVNALAEAAPQKNNLLIKVMAPDSQFWPLPWYLRRFTQVGWWPEIPPDPYAPVMIVAAGLKANLDANGTHLMAGMYELRPQTFFELYVETNLWRSSLKATPLRE